MIFSIKRVFGGSAAIPALLLAGCVSAPFIPVAVPNSASLRPEPGKDRSAEIEELFRLHKATPPAYVIAPHDTFALVVNNDAAMSRPQITVMPDGTVSIAPVGTVKLAGLTIPQACQVLREKYQKFIRNSNVFLEPQVLQNYTFTIAGMVKAPGIYPFVFGSFRLTNAIAAAQGLLTTGEKGDKQMLADLANSYIARNGRILPINFVEAVEKGNPLYNIPILNGDYIYIPSLEGGKITVLGEVAHPNCMPFQPNLTLLQAIGFSGGLRETNSRDIKVIRGGLKHPVVYNIDIKAMQMGRAMDFALKPKDIVFVPRDPVSEWNVLIRHILPTAQLLNAMAGPFGNPMTQAYGHD